MIAFVDERWKSDEFWKSCEEVSVAMYVNIPTVGYGPEANGENYKSDSERCLERETLMGEDAAEDGSTYLHVESRKQGVS